MNEQKKMTEMNEWLDEVCAALGVDRGLLAEVTPRCSTWSAGWRMAHRGRAAR